MSGCESAASTRERSMRDFQILARYPAPLPGCLQRVPRSPEPSAGKRGRVAGRLGGLRRASRRSAPADIVEVIVIESEVMRQFVQNRLDDLPFQFRLRQAQGEMRLAEDVDRVG